MELWTLARFDTVLKDEAESHQVQRDRLDRARHGFARMLNGVCVHRQRVGVKVSGIAELPSEYLSVARPAGWR